MHQCFDSLFGRWVESGCIRVGPLGRESTTVPDIATVRCGDRWLSGQCNAVGKQKRKSVRVLHQCFDSLVGRWVKSCCIRVAPLGWESSTTVPDISPLGCGDRSRSGHCNVVYICMHLCRRRGCIRMNLVLVSHRCVVGWWGYIQMYTYSCMCTSTYIMWSLLGMPPKPNTNSRCIHCA